MNNQIIVVVDADAIIAQADPNDSLHEKAQFISNNLIKVGARVIYPASAIMEASTHTQRVLNSNVSALGIVQLFSNPSFEIEVINSNILNSALEFFNPLSSKKNTIFDCVVAEIAKREKADYIFSFDKFYKKLGFKLASEL